MNKRVSIPALLLCALLLLFALVRADAVVGALQRDIIMQWLRPGLEPWTGVLSVWHVTDWLPGRGSGETWLTAVGSSFEKQYRGVFVEVRHMTIEQAEKFLADGESPDILSFPAGWGEAQWLDEIDAPPLQIADDRVQYAIHNGGLDGRTLRALPYMRGAYVLLVNTDIASEREVRMPSWEWDMEWLQKAEQLMTYDSGMGKRQTHVDGLSSVNNRYGVSELALVLRPDFAPVHPVADETAFALGKAGMCLGTLRTLYAQRAAEEEGKGVAFGAQPVGAYTDMVQYAGVWKGITGYKREYAEKYVQFLLDERQQHKLSAVGALPIVRVTEPMYERDALMRAMLDDARYPRAFGWAQAAENLRPLAKLAIDGDAAAKRAAEEALALVILGEK